MKRFITFITFFFVSLSVSSAQQAVSLTTASAAYCPYTFTRDLTAGSTGPDVKVLQQILNSDQRTVIATSGVASPGQETTSYGTATREAIKKFQALFIEYIGVANGVFGPKTRTVMNAVCNGEYYTSGKGQVYSNVSTQNTVNNNMSNVVATSTTDTTAPQIYLRSNSTSITQGVSFRIIVTASEPIQTFTPESIILEGGSVSDIRKLSPNSYSLLVTPTDGARALVAQVEADRIYDLAGNKNDNASNEIRIAITPAVSTTATTTTATVTSGITSGELDSIFNRILAQVTPATSTVQQPTTCSNGATNPPYCNNQYNQPNYNSGSNNGQNSQNSLMNMLMLSSLLRGSGSGGGGLFGGLFGGGNKQPQISGGGVQNSGGTGGSTSGGSDIGKQVTDSSNGTTTIPTPPAQPSELGGVPNSGEIIKEITCQKIAQKSGNIEEYSKCKAEGATIRFYLVKDLKEGSNVQYVLYYKGTSKDSSGKVMADLKIGTKFKQSNTNGLKKVDNKVVCKTYNVNSNPKCIESEESKGKGMFEFQAEDKVTYDTTSSQQSSAPQSLQPSSQEPQNQSTAPTPTCGVTSGFSSCRCPAGWQLSNSTDSTGKQYCYQ